MFNPPNDLLKAYDRVGNFIVDDVIGSFKPQPRWVNRPRDRDQNHDAKSNTQVRKEAHNGSIGNDKPPFRHQTDNKPYIPLNVDREDS